MKISEYSIAEKDKTIGLIKSECCGSYFGFKLKDIIHKGQKSFLKCICGKTIEIKKYS